VVLAGPVANFLIAIAIFSAFFVTIGMPQTNNLVLKLKSGSVAEKAGIHVGDRILSISGRETPTFEDISNYVVLRPDQPAVVVVERHHERLSIPLTIGSAEEPDGLGKTDRIGLLGLYGGARTYERLPFTSAIPAATSYTLKLTRSMIDGLLQIVTGRRSVSDIGGPVKIAQVAGQGAELGALPFAQLVALLSINLGFINLLPVPMLDGGHLFFYAVEAVRRRPVSAQALEWAFRGGLAVILTLMLFTTINDLASLGLWDRLQRLIG
jgi:regulator of sigma E protease